MYISKTLAFFLTLSLLDVALAQHPPMRMAGKFFPYLEKSRPKVALVLSGGGSRGISQVGVLEAFEKAHIPIDMIVGASMGSIIGGLYASGYSAEQLDSIARAQNWNQLLALSDAVSRSDLFLQQKQNEEQSFLVIRLNGFTPVLPSALVSGQRLTTLLTQLVLNAPYRVVHSFNDLKIPFRAVATDMVSGNRVVISTGDLAQAMRASSTVPVLFSPIRADSLRLVDGGLVSNIPVDVARSLGADIVIAVNTTSPLRREVNIETPWDALDQVTSIMMQLSNKLQLEKADVVITPHLESHLASDFSNLDSIIYKGKIAAEEQIAKIDSIYETKEHHLNLTKSPAAQLINLAADPSLQTDDSTASKQPYYSNSLLLISNVSFTGAHKIPDSLLIKPFNDLLGHFVTPEQMDRACEKLIWIYRRADLGMARLQSVEYDSVNAVLNIDISEGHISNISLSGNIVAMPFLIRREFPLSRDNLFLTSKAIQGINNIYSTNLFSQVLLWTRFDPSPNLTIDVAEKSSRLMRFGLRVDNERNGQLFASLSDEDLFGTGTRIGFSFAGGIRNRLGEVFLGTTRILNTELTYNFHAFTGFRDVYNYVDQPNQGNSTVWNRISDGQYRIIRDGYEFSIGTQIKRFGMVDAVLGYGWDKIKPLQTFYDNFSKRIVSLKIGSYIDTRDKSAFSKSGILSNVYFETSLKGLNSEMSFSKIFFDYETYSTVFSNFTLKQHYEFGFGDATLPLTRQFSLGGQDLFYGLPEDALRGRQVFLASAELRVKLPIKIFFDTYLSGRFDLGDVWAQQQNIILKTLKQGIGGYLGFDTPIGPAVFGVGKAFYPGKDSRFPTLSTPLTFYFKVGVEIPTVSPSQ
ncbi:MAG: patatin-like phospholipase family protein [Bacteroidetes bacterium]|nr:patatin-like phospholipase family protein [Bacteroidota bacterium]